jgi:hypothetical protein
MDYSKLNDPISIIVLLLDTIRAEKIQPWFRVKGHIITVEQKIYWE